MAEIKEKYLVTIDGNEFELNLSRQGDGLVVEHNGDKYRVTIDNLSGQKFLFRMNEYSSEVSIASNNGFLEIFLDGQDMSARVEPYSLAELRKRAGTSAESQGTKLIRAPMPGLVLKAAVGPGDDVAKGATLVIIEAMKMENMIKSPSAAKIKEVFVSSGQAVDKNDKLIEFE